MSHSIFLAVQAHPALDRFVHILINAVPDSAFALLAVAGLAYLVPGYTKKLEDKRGVRVFLMIFFTMFGAMAIIINAVNREAQDYKDGQNEDRMGVVLKSVTNIQEALKPKTVNMTEAERQLQLLNSLRDEYIIRQSSIDPEILNGTKMPPAEWVNKRLTAVGEKWTVKEEAKPAPSQIVQLSPEAKQARLLFSFFQSDMSVSSLKTLQLDSITDGKINVRVAAIVAGDTPAENLQVWIRVCKDCQWIPPEPSGLSVSGPDFPFDRATFMQELLPNVISPIWNLAIQSPHYSRYESVAIGCYYSCKNCPPVDWNKPQVLWVTRSMLAGAKLQFPSISYTPEPVKK